jgi:hypothetical protein
MERSEFLKKMRARTEAMYDHFAPAYWVTYGNYDNSVHCQFRGAIQPPSPMSVT